jgi:hypothetical protein
MPPGLVVNFTDSQLQDCYERSIATVTDLSAELRQVRALIGAQDLFQMLEGPHSSRVHETIEHLLVPGLRPGLRRWYQRSGAETNPCGWQKRRQEGITRDRLMRNMTCA